MIELVVSTKELETRLSNRLHDPVTNVTYGASSAIPQSDTVRARLKRRSDDDHTVVQTRLRTYEREMPLVRRVFKDAGVPIVRVCGGGRDVDDVCEGVREAVGGRTRVVMAGAPGCGKGTQGGLLAQLEGPIHVSTSDLLRGNEH